jgi:hypothetical protein
MKAASTQAKNDSLLQRLDAQDREIQRLRALVEGGGEKSERPARSRRDLLKLAGAAVLGAAGAAALRTVPAAAATGDIVTIGGNFSATSSTYITTSVASALTLKSTAPSGAGVWATSTGNGGYGVVAIAGPNGEGIFADSTSGPLGVGGTFYGSRANLHLGSFSSPMPPTSTQHYHGDILLEGWGMPWICVNDGTPGSFVPFQAAGANITHFVKVMNKQYSLVGSDGKTWVDMDATNLVQTITPLFNAQAVISASADLWTMHSGFNQDIGIFISGGAYGAGQIVAWKESGGSAGTYSPNAAFVETTQPMVQGTTYTIKVRWKANAPSAGGTIMAGAGPLAPGSGGGGVAGQISPTRLATHLVVDVQSPAVLR